MFFKASKKPKERCFYCGIKFEDLALIDGKKVCYICLRADTKGKKQQK